MNKNKTIALITLLIFSNLCSIGFGLFYQSSQQEIPQDGYYTNLGNTTIIVFNTTIVNYTDSPKFLMTSNYWQPNETLWEWAWDRDYPYNTTSIPVPEYTNNSYIYHIYFSSHYGYESNYIDYRLLFNASWAYPLTYNTTLVGAKITGIAEDSHFFTWQSINKSGRIITYDWFEVAFFMQGIIPLGGDYFLSQYLTIKITTIYENGD